MNPADWNPFVWLAIEAFALVLILYWKGWLGDFYRRPVFAPSSKAHFQAAINAARQEAEAKHAEQLADQMVGMIRESYHSPFQPAPGATPATPASPPGP